MTTHMRLLIAVTWMTAGLTPGTAFAHARLTKSAPAANQRLTVMPTFVRLWFSEAPEFSMTRIVLTDAAGKLVAVDKIERDESNLAVRFRITGHLVAGRYRVAWKVAASDGHPSQGAFKFTVLPEAVRAATPPSADSVATAASEDTAGFGVDDSTDDEPSAESVGYVLARALSFGAVLVLIGAVAFRAFVLGRASLSETDKARMRVHAARYGWRASLALLVAALVRVLFQAAMMGSADESAASMVPMMVRDTQWGHVWIAHVCVAIVAAGAFAMARRGSAHPWWLAASAALGLSVTSALAGHAASGQFAPIAVVTDAAHVLAASAWLGGLLCVLAIGTRSAQPRRRKGERAKAIVAAFSPMALVSASVVVATGGISAWLRLGGFSALWASSYGRVLLLKMAALSGVVVTGAYNWRRVRPALGTPAASGRLRRSGSAELAFGCLVLGVTAVLVAMPTPLDVAHQ